jgi:hypothetical protein
MQAKGRTCPRSELLREVWQATPSAGTNVVDVYVNYLRKKLAAVRAQNFDGILEADNIIETVRGEGYALTGGSARKQPHSVWADGLPTVVMNPNRHGRRDARSDSSSGGPMGSWGLRVPARA